MGIAVNLTGGVLRSNGGVSDAAASYYALGGGSAVNTLASATTAVVSGRINLREGNAGNTLTFTTADGAAAIDLNVTAAVTEGGGARNIAKAGAGVMQLTGLNTYTGTTTVLAGVLSVSDLTVGAASHVGSNDGSAAFLVLNGGALRYTGAGATTGRLFTLGTAGGTLEANGTGALVFDSTGTIALTGADTARTLTLGGTSGAALVNTLAPVLGDNGTGLTSVVKTGANTWALTGANVYTGTTAVNAGTLMVNSTLGAVVVNSGATLGGTGGVGNVTVAGGGTLRPGDATAAGTLTAAGSLTLSAGSTLSVRVTTAGAGDATGTGGSTDAGGVHNKVAGGGSATLNSLLNVFVDVTGSTFTYNTQQSYRVITGAGDQSGLNITDPARFTFAGLGGVDTFDVINVSLRGDAGGNVFLNFTPVPEPATVLGVGAAVLGLGAVIRRRRTAAAPAVAA